ncbi:MAG: hypothetical protein H0T42_34725 [Deltaproteobacteria bacterium]|nr:hypothetical protein [Deltaproteobacteria bacterium]
MTRALCLLLTLSACSTDLAGSPAPRPASVRERLQVPTQLRVNAGESGGAITAERKVVTGWDAALVELGVENGELIVSSDAPDAVTVDGLQVVFKPLEIPQGVFGGSHARLTNVRIDLSTERRAAAVWTSDNEVHLTAVLGITLHWTLSLDGASVPLGSPELPPIPVDIRLTGDGEAVHGELRARAPGELWAWAGLIRLSELQLVLGAELHRR